MYSTTRRAYESLCVYAVAMETTPYPTEWDITSDQSDGRISPRKNSQGHAGLFLFLFNHSSKQKPKPYTGIISEVMTPVNRSNPVICQDCARAP